MKTYSVQKLQTKKGELNIYGEAYVPNEDKKHTTMIISHGFNGSYKYMAEYAEELAKAGIACYVYDFCGGSALSKSDGSTRQMSVLTEKEDLGVVINMIKQQPWVDQEKIYLVGESQGGMVSALLAPHKEKDIAGLILIYPALIIPDDGRKRFNSIEEVPEKLIALGMPVGKRYYKDILSMNVWKEIDKYQGRVLLIHGTADTLVPIDYSRKASQVYRDASIYEIEGAGHGFNNREIKLACKQMKEWLQKVEHANI